MRSISPIDYLHSLYATTDAQWGQKNYEFAFLGELLDSSNSMLHVQKTSPEMTLTTYLDTEVMKEERHKMSI